MNFYDKCSVLATEIFLRFLSKIKKNNRQDTEEHMQKPFRGIRNTIESIIKMIFLYFFSLTHGSQIYVLWNFYHNFIVFITIVIVGRDASELMFDVNGTSGKIMFDEYLIPDIIYLAGLWKHLCALLIILPVQFMSSNFLWSFCIPLATIR